MTTTDLLNAALNEYIREIDNPEKLNVNVVRADLSAPTPKVHAQNPVHNHSEGLPGYQHRGQNQSSTPKPDRGFLPLQLIRPRESAHTKEQQHAKPQRAAVAPSQHH